MSCGCKGKKVIVPAQQPRKVIIVENGEIKTRDPAPSPAPPMQDVNNIVNKLKEITIS
jgi:hypothetical protein